MQNSSAPSFSLQLALAFLSTGFALTAAPVITGLDVRETEVVLTYQDDGAANQFDLEVNPGLDPQNWSRIADPVITPLGGNQFRFRISRTAADKEFYRVIGRFLGTGLDRDGDGIDNDRETTEFGTNPDRFDTDRDGFGDATEIALGTDPTDINDFPELAHLPAVDFTEALSAIEEGEGSQTISLSASPSYTGQVSISVNARSSAVQGTDYTSVPTSVSMSGGTATFDITILDDLEIRPSRMLILDVTSGADYRAGGSVTHVINISDNDAYWFGSLRDELTERSFRICIVRDAASVQANFVSGQSDGLPDPDGGASSLSTGIIPDTPQDTWPATSISYSLATPAFSASVIDLPSTESSVISDPILRNLTLTSTPNTDGSHTVASNLISGNYTEQIRHATDPNTTYLNRTLTGTFSLVREIAPAPAINSPFDPLDN